MSKYSAEFKLEIVKSVIDDDLSSGEASRKFGVSKSDVQKWVAAYKIHGLTALERKHVEYTGEFKQQLIQEMIENHLSLRETAAKYNIANHTTIAIWERIYHEEGPEGLQIERRGRISKTPTGCKLKMGKKAEEDLIAEVQRLRMENAYLKKLNALVLEKEKSQQKTKLK